MFEAVFVLYLNLRLSADGASLLWSSVAGYNKVNGATLPPLAPFKGQQEEDGLKKLVTGADLHVKVH